MLRLLNKSKRSQNAIWIVASAMVVLGMVVFYAPMRRATSIDGRDMPVNDADSIAEVDKQEITARDYISGLQGMMQMYQQFMSQSGKQMDFAQAKNMGLDKNVLQSLIRKKIIALEVKRLNLEPTDAEVKNRIKEQFTVNGAWIGYDKFQRYVERTGMTVPQFEDALRDQIADEKLRSLITSSIQVSPQEVQEQFNKENTSFSVLYAVLEASKITDKVTFTDDDIKKYFEAHKADFRITKSQRKVDYIFVSQDSVSKNLEISDEELKKDYSPEKFISEAKIQQIMLKALADKDRETVMAKASELVNRARGANGVKAEDFGALARGNTQDTATKDKDGDLGFIKKDTLKPGSYLQRAFSMKPGEISDPIADGNNVYIIKVNEIKNKSFEEAKEGLLAAARNKSSYKRASDLADEVAKQLADKKDIKAVAAEVAKKQGLKEEETLKQTPLFSEGDDVPGIGSNPSFEEAVASLKAVGDVGVKVGIRGGFAIPKLVEIKEPHDAKLEEVKSKVEEKYKEEKVKDLASDQAKTILASANGTTDGLKAAAEKAGLKVNTRDDFKDGQSLENFLDQNKITPALMKLKQGEVVKEPIFGNDKYLLLGITKRNEPDTKKYTEQAKAIEERLLEERRTMIYDAYLDNAKKKLKNDKKIVVHKDVIEKILKELGSQPVAGQ